MARRFVLALLAASPAAFAHHSFAMFDMQKEVSLDGTVKSFQWSSPHSWLEVMVHTPSGDDVEWSIEMGAPSSLYRHGWRQTSVKQGDKVTVVVHPLRDGRPGGSLVSVTLPDGKQLRENARPTAPAGKPAAGDGAAGSQQ